MSADVQCDVDSPVQVRDQHYDFDFDSDVDQPSPHHTSPPHSASALPALKRSPPSTRSSVPSPPPAHSLLRSKDSARSDGPEEHKERAGASSSPSPPPVRAATLPAAFQLPLRPSGGHSSAKSVVLSSAALQSLSALKKRRSVARAVSAVSGKPRRDSGGEDDGSAREIIHTHSRSHNFSVDRDDENDDQDEEDDEDDDEEDDDDCSPHHRHHNHSHHDHEERLPPLHSSPPAPSTAASSLHPPLPRRSSQHTSLYASTPSPTPSVPLLLPSAAPRPRTRAASAFPSLSSHHSSSSISSLASTATIATVSSSSSLSQPDVIYTPTESLTAFDQPGAALSHLPRQLQSADWSVRFDALTTLRRLLLHHPAVLSPSTLKALLRDVRAEVDSLRSLLAKNAISTLSLLFQSLPRVAEPELLLLLPPLLKRAGETSGAFLAEEAERALLCMIDHCTAPKVLAVLVACADKGNKIVRSQAVQWTARAVEATPQSQGSEVVELEGGKVLRALGLGCGDAGAGVRGWCKRALQRLGEDVGLDELDRQLRHVLTSIQMAAVKKLVFDRRQPSDASDMSLPDSRQHSVSFNVSKQQLRGGMAAGMRGRVPGGDMDGGALSISGSSAFEYPKEIDTSFSLDSTASSLSPHSSSSTSSTASSSAASASSPLRKPSSSILKRRSTLSLTSTGSSRPSLSSSPGRSQDATPPAELLPSIVADMTSADWRTRLHSIEALSSLCSSYPSAVSTALVDPLLSLIQDNNGKVIIAAMHALPQLLPALLPVIPLHPLLLRLTANLASSNITVRSLSSSVLDLLSRLCPDPPGSGVLMQPYSQCVLYGNTKVRVLVLEKMIELLVAKGKPAGKGGSSRAVSGVVMGVMWLKWAIPVCFLWADEGRAEVKALLQRLTLLVYGAMGSEMFDAQLMLSLKLSTTAVRKMKAMLDIP